MRRISRCAQDNITEDEIKNGAMPMSSRRAMAPGASLQCIVDKTWWPVSAASMAISAVSVSRISPIMTQNGAQRAGECQADVFFRRHLVDAWNLEFHRVFDGDDVVNRAVEFVERGIKRRCFSRTGRAGDEDQSVRRVNGGFELFERVGVKPEFVEARGQIGFVEDAQHDFLAVDGWQNRNA